MGPLKDVRPPLPSISKYLQKRKTFVPGVLGYGVVPLMDVLTRLLIVSMKRSPQIEENKVEISKKDKVATEKLLQETIDKNKAELAAQKEDFMNATKEEKSLAEARANNEARNELESCLRGAGEQEAMLDCIEKFNV